MWLITTNYLTPSHCLYRCFVQLEFQVGQKFPVNIKNVLNGIYKRLQNILKTY